MFDSECLARINSNDDSLGECDVFWTLCRSCDYLFICFYVCCLGSEVLETGWIMGIFFCIISFFFQLFFLN